MIREVTISGRTYRMRHSLRVLFVYEEIAGKPYEGGSLQSAYVLCYACLLANNPDSFSMTFPEFIDACDADPGIFRMFAEMVGGQNRLDAQAADSKKKETGNL